MYWYTIGQTLTQQEHAPAPEQPPRTAKLMAALCYLNVLILIPACTKWRHDEFVKFH